MFPFSQEMVNKAMEMVKQAQEAGQRMAKPRRNKVLELKGQEEMQIENSAKAENSTESNGNEGSTL